MVSERRSVEAGARAVVEGAGAGTTVRPHPALKGTTPLLLPHVLTLPLGAMRRSAELSKCHTLPNPSPAAAAG